ncbi:hypothetical protein FRC0293_00061 [Corynebacterium diphtheriae]|nr:hypothetical protein FRC0293_00061 [Corynebacterium diphtheriae]CAB0829648.1 hypothetical protein FRC0294_00061 [Corynebacterium diphtheriae]
MPQHYESVDAMEHVWVETETELMQCFDKTLVWIS